jgi:hypothetical protein
VLYGNINEPGNAGASLWNAGALRPSCQGLRKPLC